MNYPIKVVEELWIISYTQKKYSNPMNLFLLENMYFKNTLQKINTIKNIVFNWDYVIFDTETNWLNRLWESLPFQIAAIKYRDWERIDNINLIINIWVVDDFILDLTGISQEEINNWIEPIEAIEIFLDFIKDDNYIIWHNAWNFDINILNNLIVSQNYLLNQNIKIYDSMQMYYSFYKHILQQWITWSSLDYMSKVLFKIDINIEKRHQADYDCELVDYLLKYIKRDFENNIDIIESEIEEFDKIENFKGKIENNIYSENTLKFLKQFWTDINNEFNYYEELLWVSIELQNAISNYIQEKTWKSYTEYYIWDIYISKNDKFKTIQNKYLSNYQWKVTKFITDKGYEIEFFREHDIFDTSIVIKNDDELLKAVEKNIELRKKMVESQMFINKRLSILRYHINLTKNKFSTYWKLNIEYWYEIKYNNNTPFVENIIKDIKNWTITCYEDMLEERNYNTNLTTTYIDMNNI